MLNDVWSGLVNEVETSKRHYDELEVASVTTNEHLNDAINALDTRIDKWETKYRSLSSLYDDICTIINAQQRKIHDMDQRISYYSCKVVALEGQKAEAVQSHFDSLEQPLAGQDNQIKILQARLAIAERGRCRCGEDTKVISCRCFE